MSITPIITIDGHSGSGKGTVSARVAEHLGFRLLDSGALYRALGIAAYNLKVDLNKTIQITELINNIEIKFGANGPGTVLLNGEDITLMVRSELGGKMASKIGAIPEARKSLFGMQLAFRDGPGLVADGRDMGTVVFPDALLKIFLTASVQERAERRYKQLIDKGIDAILPDLLRDLKERDKRDTERIASPLKPAEEAVIIDSTDLSIQTVVDQVLTLFSTVIKKSPQR